MVPKNCRNSIGFQSVTNAPPSSRQNTFCYQICSQRSLETAILKMGRAQTCCLWLSMWASTDLRQPDFPTFWLPRKIVEGNLCAFWFSVIIRAARIAASYHVCAYLRKFPKDRDQFGEEGRRWYMSCNVYDFSLKYISCLFGSNLLASQEKQRETNIF